MFATILFGSSSQSSATQFPVLSLVIADQAALSASQTPSGAIAMLIIIPSLLVASFIPQNLLHDPEETTATT